MTRRRSRQSRRRYQAPPVIVLFVYKANSSPQAPHLPCLKPLVPSPPPARTAVGRSGRSLARWTLSVPLLTRRSPHNLVGILERSLAPAATSPTPLTPKLPQFVCHRPVLSYRGAVL